MVGLEESGRRSPERGRLDAVNGPVNVVSLQAGHSGQYVVAIFSRLREGVWWRAPLVSTLIGSTVDTALFFFIAFSAGLTFGAAADANISWAQDAAPLLLTGPEAPLWVTLAIADWGVKLSIALIALIPFRLIVSRLRQGAA